MNRMRQRKSSPIFVSFSGIDGSGKSTQIGALSAHMKSAGLVVRVIPFWDEIATFTSVRETTGHALFKGEKGVGSPDKPINRRDKNIQSWPMTGLRYFLYFSDAISLRRTVHKALQSDADFIIFDRYAYDELANLPLNSRISRAYVRFILRFVPKPNISWVLDADPVQARARKPEYPLDFLFICRQAYLTLSQLSGEITVIPPMSVPEVKSRILDQALLQLPALHAAQNAV